MFTTAKRSLSAVLALGLVLSLADANGLFLVSTATAAPVIYATAYDNGNSNVYTITLGAPGSPGTATASVYATLSVNYAVSQAIAVDTNDNVYVAAQDVGNNNEVVKIAPGPSQSIFYNPADNDSSGRNYAVDLNTNTLYGASESNGRAWIYAQPGGTQTSTAGSPGVGISVSVSSGGLLYASGIGTGVYTYSGGTWTEINTNGPSYSEQSAVDGNGNYIAGDFSSNELNRYDATGNSVDLLATTSASRFDGVAIDPVTGEIYAVDDGGNIWTFNSDGTNAQEYHMDFTAFHIAIFDEAAPAGVPEPSTFVLAAMGLAGLGLVAWRKRRARG